MFSCLINGFWRHFKWSSVCRCLATFIVVTLIMACGQSSLPTDPIVVTELSKSNVNLSFAVTSDVHEYAGDYPTFFRGACEEIETIGKGSFMVTLGDMTPPSKVYQTVNTYLGDSYPWYPIVGNHDVESELMISWLRNYNPGGRALPNIINHGPTNSIETAYSFEYNQAHFVVLNEYFDGNNDWEGDGDIVDSMAAWLEDDLSKTNQPIKIVFGHEPAFPQPDMENGVIRHVDDSLNNHQANRDRFWDILKRYEVTAYFCGHSHTYSSANIQGVWQINCGHTQGSGDTGTRSTFLLVHIDQSNRVICDTYRIANDLKSYYIAESIFLN